MALTSALGSVVSWLRAGYPEGVPQQDYLPLFALLRRQLDESEVEAVAAELARDGDPDSARAVRHAITAVTSAEPLDGDVSRVRARLAAGGWPLTTLRS